MSRGFSRVMQGRHSPTRGDSTYRTKLLPNQYNCLNCPGYCCSYPVIAVTKRDVERIAKALHVSFEEAEKTFTRPAHGHKRVLRRQPDKHFGRICKWFDTEKRRCTIYRIRPEACRAYPGTGRCGYYDFLMFERRTQDDPEFVASTDNSQP